MAEVLHHFFPKLVELHNYRCAGLPPALHVRAQGPGREQHRLTHVRCSACSSAHSIQQKQYNWGTLNTRVCRKLGFSIAKPDVDAVVNAVPGAIERVLQHVRVKTASQVGNSEHAAE